MIMHMPLAEGNFCDECGNAHTPAAAEENLQSWLYQQRRQNG
jgi:hypothetical protein